MQIYIGWDDREAKACKVAEYSLWKHQSVGALISGFLSSTHIAQYNRPEEMRGNQRWDLVSDAPMSTMHACVRFFVPFLSGFRGLALFVDGDVFFRKEGAHKLFSLANSKCAVQCVFHPDYLFEEQHGTKMDGQIQTSYKRKNWSSVMLFNCGHESNRWLTPDNINKTPGRDLHRFCWLHDWEIGELPKEYNHLVGVNEQNSDAKIVHHTLGPPNMEGYEDSEFADEWFCLLEEADVCALPVTNELVRKNF